MAGNAALVDGPHLVDGSRMGVGAGRPARMTEATAASPRKGRLAKRLGLAAALLAVGCSPPQIAHGPVVGDLTATGAVVWVRGDRAGTLRVQLDGPGYEQRWEQPVTEATDFAGKAVFQDLTPATEYRVRVAISGLGPGRSSAEGRFTTAPPPDAPAPVRFAFGGDLAGQNVCRDAREDFPIFAALDDWRPAFFIGLGDMIYADDRCDGTGRYGNAQVPGGFPASETLEDFRAHWRYARDDPGFAAFLSRTPYIAVWDDHEVTNDFGPSHAGAGDALLPLGLRAFLEHNPVAPPPEDPARLHRSLRWGRHLELFVLDTRQHRAANSRVDRGDRPKSMLGPEQRRWLVDRVAASDATWKLVVSSVPMSIPTGSDGAEGRDGWADHTQETGFERELSAILETLAARRVRNLFWITTDVHFAAAFRYRPVPADPEFVVHELATGPLHAGVFLKQDFDRSLGAERLFLYGPPDPYALLTYAQARRYFNAGAVVIDADGDLRAEVHDVEGRTLFALGPASGAGGRARSQLRPLLEAAVGRGRELHHRVERHLHMGAPPRWEAGGSRHRGRAARPGGRSPARASGSAPAR